MPKSRPQIDVLVLGSHPACYFAAALLKTGDGALGVAHATIPGEPLHDRLVQINPQFFSLHKHLGPLKRANELVPVHGLRFLADEPPLCAEHQCKSIVAYIGSLKQIRILMIELARAQHAELIDTRSLEIRGIDEQGVELSINGRRIKPRLLLVGGPLSAQQRKVLGIVQPPDADPLRRYTFVRMKVAKSSEPGEKPIMPMSLDLMGSLHWGWMQRGAKGMQIAVEQPAAGADSSPAAKCQPIDLLRHWINVLAQHGALKIKPGEIDLSDAQTIELPLAAALSQESVANRTLLIGPAGGFYTACAEDVYPNCWSALFAVEVAQKALHERHLQDAIQPYRHRWGTTLGDYLRGPQQNLRFLLPLVYRNPVMTARMTEAILLGASVVR